MYLTHNEILELIYFWSRPFLVNYSAAADLATPSFFIEFAPDHLDEEVDGFLGESSQNGHDERKTVNPEIRELGVNSINAPSF
jgi:hypothetical protein